MRVLGSNPFAPTFEGVKMAIFGPKTAFLSCWGL